MLDGWYCRTMGIKNEPDDTSKNKETINYEARYRMLKRKLKFLIYENESFQEALRSTQRSLIKVNRDKSFLLDRLLHYERQNVGFSGSDETDSTSDDTSDQEMPKKSNIDLNQMSEPFVHSASPPAKRLHSEKKKKSIVKIEKTSTSFSFPPQTASSSSTNIVVSEGHMTPEEVERHLESRQTYLELVPEKAPPTVPTEMFSNDLILDSLE